MPHIYKAAYDGNIDEVKKLLAMNSDLLDARFKETLPELSVPVAYMAFFIKKSLGATFGALTFVFASVMTVETWGAALFSMGLAAGTAKGFWEYGDSDLHYHMRNINHWTPLDCAVFGYINGNESALSVALYLIEQGANGSVLAGSCNKKFYEAFGNETLSKACGGAILARTQKQELVQAQLKLNNFDRDRNQLLRERKELQDKIQLIEEQQTQLQNRLIQTEAERIELNASLRVSQEQAEDLYHKLEEIMKTLTRFRFIGSELSGTQIYAFDEEEQPRPSRT